MKSKQINTGIPADLHAALKEQAARMGISLQILYQIIFEEWVASKKGNEK